MQPFKKFIYNYDMFANVPGFRARTEASVVSYFGGFVSLILLVGFFYLFLADAIKIINYKKIQAKQTTKVSVTHIQITQRGTQNVSNFVFALGIQYQQLSFVEDYLQFWAYQANYTNDVPSYNEIQLVRCTQDMFPQIANLSDYWELYELDQKKCFSSASSSLVSGLITDPKYFTIQLEIYQCVQLDCANNSARSAYFSQYVARNRFFTVDFFILNTGFNPGDKDATFKFLDSSTWITFSNQIGTQVQLLLGTYKVETDESFFPWEQKTTQTGYYVQKAQTATYNPQTLTEPSYMIMQIRMGRESKELQRKYGKFDETLGYVGGLFSVVFGFFAFFLMKYNQYRYQLIAGQGAFSFPNGVRYSEEQFNFLTYIKYSIYDWIRLLCCCAPDWENCKRIEETRDEVCQIIDIKNFMRRLSHLEHINSLRITQDEDLIINLAEPMNILHAQKKRKMLNYCETVMKGKTHLTIGSINMVKNIFSLQKDKLRQLGSFSVKLSRIVAREENLTESERKIQTLEEAFRKYQNYLQEQSEKIQLTEEEEQVQKELSEVYFRVSKDIRNQFMEKIPLLILYRIHRVHSKQSSDSMEEKIVSQQNASFKKIVPF